MVRLFYCSITRLPSKRAHTYQIISTCEALAKLDIDLYLVVPRRLQPEKELIGKDTFEYYGLGKRFGISRVFCIDLMPYMSGFLDVLAFNLCSFTYALAASVFLLSNRSNERSIVHSREAYLSLIVSFIKGMLNIRSFYELHDEPDTIIQELAVKRSDGVVVITSALRELCIKLGVPEKKILLAHDAVKISEQQLAKEEARELLGIKSENKVVVYTGGFERWKGVYVLLDAACILDNLDFYFVGGIDKELEDFKSAAKSKGAKNVFVTGYVKPQIATQYQAAADVLVIPNSKSLTVSRLYTSPLKLFEYMAAKRPIVASDLPSTREVLDESTCIFAEPDNAQSFADGILTALKNPKIAEKAYGEAKEKYTWDVRARKMLAFEKGF